VKNFSMVKVSQLKSEQENKSAFNYISGHPLEVLGFCASTSPAPIEWDIRISPVDVEVAVEKGFLRNLECVFVSRSTSWKTRLEPADELQMLGLTLMETHPDAYKTDPTSKRRKFPSPITYDSEDWLLMYGGEFLFEG
jgi:hypothetical protein